MKRIRGGSGLGDALYVQAVARHIVMRGEHLEVCTAWPDVFKPLSGKISIAPFSRQNIDYLAHYSQRKMLTETNQFQDCCNAAGIQEPVDFKLDWKLEGKVLQARVREAGKPIVVVQMPRAPMGRTDGFCSEILPDCKRIQRAIDLIGANVTIVQVGSGIPLFAFRGIDFDLSNRTTISQLLDIASIASGFLGYVSCAVPMAESFSRPGLFVWSRRGLNSGAPYARAITPKKILHRPSSRYVIDDCTDQELADATESFLRAIHG
jgi:hypothetical protein